MRYVRIFLLHFQNAFIYKGISFVYFLAAILNIGLTVLFWKGATGTKEIAPGWFFSDIFTYYVLALVANQLLMSHMENTVANIDIHEGNLSAHLLKPFSYFLTRLMSETPWRFVSTILGLTVFTFFFFIVKTKISLVTSPFAILSAIIIVLGGYFIAFIFKMILGILAFWFTEMRGLFEGTDAATAILAGGFMPLALLPVWVVRISNYTPFPYMLYFPVIAFEGKLSFFTSIEVIGRELLWIIIMGILYKFLWGLGIKKYSAVG